MRIDSFEELAMEHADTARGWQWLVSPRAQRAAIVLFEISYLRFEI